jgi:hypothetical protein
MGTNGAIEKLYKLRVYKKSHKEKSKMSLRGIVQRRPKEKMRQKRRYSQMRNDDKKSSHRQSLPITPAALLARPWNWSPYHLSSRETMHKCEP